MPDNSTREEYDWIDAFFLGGLVIILIIALVFVGIRISSSRAAQKSVALIIGFCVLSAVVGWSGLAIYHNGGEWLDR
jgi:hypothetical protein